MCERCPLADACPLARDDLDERLARAEPACELSEGDVQADFFANTEPPRARRVTSLGIELVVTLTNAVSGDRDLMRAALTLAMKVGRVSGYFEPRSAEAWSADAVPNLLLVEQLMRSVRHGLAERSELHSVAMKAEEMLKEIEELLAPLVRCVDARSRERLSRLIAANQAPSPFCTLGGPVLCSPK